MWLPSVTASAPACSGARLSLTRTADRSAPNEASISACVDGGSGTAPRVATTVAWLPARACMRRMTERGSVVSARRRLDFGPATSIGDAFVRNDHPVSLSMTARDSTSAAPAAQPRRDEGSAPHGGGGTGPTNVPRHELCLRRWRAVSLASPPSPTTGPVRRRRCLRRSQEGVRGAQSCVRTRHASSNQPTSRTGSQTEPHRPRGVVAGPTVGDTAAGGLACGLLGAHLSTATETSATRSSTPSPRRSHPPAPASTSPDGTHCACRRRAPNGTSPVRHPQGLSRIRPIRRRRVDVTASVRLTQPISPPPPPRHRGTRRTFRGSLPDRLPGPSARVVPRALRSGSESLADESTTRPMQSADGGSTSPLQLSTCSEQGK